jgi:hypothetical protein
VCNKKSPSKWTGFDVGVAGLKKAEQALRLLSSIVIRFFLSAFAGYFGLTMPAISVKPCHFERSSKVG